MNIVSTTSAGNVSDIIVGYIGALDFWLERFDRQTRRLGAA